MISEEVTLNLLLRYLNGMNNLVDTENFGKPVAMIKHYKVILNNGNLENHVKFPLVYHVKFPLSLEFF